MPQGLKPTDTSNPEHFLRVVDCQWGCPAHTDVPLYIRLISQGRFTDAYMVNRQSNVFPGILGRVCDRPCEPVCRRKRVDEDQKPVAICRLKRVAADFKDEIEERLPEIPEQKNGKRVACIGAGCASLTVANDLVPLGYEVTVFERFDRPGGLMRTNIPAFRLPGEVLDEEIGYILDMGVDLRLNSEVESMAALLDEGFDAVFVGSGAPRGKELSLPGREEGDANIHIGIDWLESVAFGHIEEIGEKVLIIGVGNTAMDCCRTSLRLGANEVKVMARKPRGFFKASDWELEDAEEEAVEIIVNHSPKEFVVEDGRLTGMRFDVMEYEVDNGRITEQRVVGEKLIPCDDVVLAIGQENAFPWIERDLGIEFDQWDVPVVDRKTMQSTRPGVFFGGDAAFGPENIIWAVAHGHEAAISIHRHCMGEPLDDRLPKGLNLSSTKMGLHEWSFSNDFDPSARRMVPHVDLRERFKKINIEVELGFSFEEFKVEVERCLNCDIQTVFDGPKCIECDACIDVCPTNCLTITENGEEEDLRQRLTAPTVNPDEPLFVSEPLKQTRRVMVKDEDQCIHCGLCAERCPTAAWDMQKSTIVLPYAKDEAERLARDSRKRRKAG
ncbi:MAG: FAD-dependent oxidoreductase [Xanthomonadales bacterium]|nr:FAD-dependent oxidoreductase [Xanthomonadales bacterium]